LLFNSPIFPEIIPGYAKASEFSLRAEITPG